MATRAEFEKREIKNRLALADSSPVVAPVVDSPVSLSFDLDQINFAQIAKDLSAELSRPQPSGWLGGWFRRRSIAANNQSISLLTDAINQIRAANEAAINLKVELFLAPQLVEAAMRNQIEGVRIALEKMLVDHERHVHEVKHKSEMEAIERARAELELEKMVIDNSKASAVVSLIKRISSSMDMSNISPEQAFVLISLLGNSSGGIADEVTKMKMAEHQFESMRRDNERKHEDIRTARAAADTAEAQAELNRSKAKKAKEKL